MQMCDRPFTKLLQYYFILWHKNDTSEWEIPLSWVEFFVSKTVPEKSTNVGPDIALVGSEDFVLAYFHST